MRAPGATYVEAEQVGRATNSTVQNSDIVTFIMHTERKNIIFCNALTTKFVNLTFFKG
jgi:hypothetical protein